ncbi:ABATE domain-containing protein [Actinocrispum sp. NPDC049592]|uniref:CGNR zinc finger domain-containing protein n=1 Tax=Actinocrispum sp. NPDC049592 TaxID=3154835 RepID=UPI003429877E
MHAFPCGNLALDFVGTLKSRRDEAPAEMLTSPRMLDAWLTEAGITDVDPGTRPADLAGALALREAIYSLISARMAQYELDSAAIEIVNRAARFPPAVPELSLTGRTDKADAIQGLSTVARVAIDILSGPHAHLLKECGRPECTQVYLDLSRGFRREWCAMETCGNKMKAAAYRARKRGNPPLSPARGPA